MKSTVILFTNNGIGTAPEDLRLTLVKNYMNLLKEEHELPVALLFYGEGVRLISEGSQVIEALNELAEKGVKVIACKTCLNYFGILEKVKTGLVGTMADILAYQLKAEKVITL